MPCMLKLETLAYGDPSTITSISAGSLSLGRSSDNDVVIDAEGVSRLHALIQQAGDSWVFRDLGSTNKSWVNGIEVSQGQVRLLRNHDVIQLADFPLRVSDLSKEDISGLPDVYVSVFLLVFVGGKFREQVDLIEPDDRLVLGGPEANFNIEGFASDNLIMVIARNLGRLELTVGKVGPTVKVGGVGVRGTTSLVDRDEIDVEELKVVVSDSSSLVPQLVTKGQYKAGPRSPSGVTVSGEWRSEAVRRKNTTGRPFVFGQEVESRDVAENDVNSGEIDETSSAFPVSSLHRFSQFKRDDENTSGSSLSESVVIFIGVATFLAIIFVVVLLFYPL